MLSNTNFKRNSSTVNQAHKPTDIFFTDQQHSVQSREIQDSQFLDQNVVEDTYRGQSDIFFRNNHSVDPLFTGENSLADTDFSYSQRQFQDKPRIPSHPSRRHFDHKNDSNLFSLGNDSSDRYELTSRQYGASDLTFAQILGNQESDSHTSHLSSESRQEMTHGLTSEQLNRPSRGKGGHLRESLKRGSQIWF